MQDVHLHELDLNLLVALRALLAERHVTRAAGRLGVTQPAMSHALSRLRAALGDPLFVRTPAGMMPTPRAEAMAGPLEHTLEELARIVGPPPTFDPSRSTRRFRVVTDDYGGLVVLPKLVQRVWQRAPGVDIVALPNGPRAGRDLAEGRVDAILGIVDAVGTVAGAYSQRLFHEKFVCVVREGHPTVRKRISLEAFIGLPHALVSPIGKSGSVVDTALAKLGRKRRVAIEIPHFLVAPHVVRQTDVVLTLAERIAMLAGDGLRILPHPLDLRGFTVSLLWHERRHADPAHVWLRSVVADVAKGL